MPQVSVVLPVYNGGNTIVRTLRSIQDQTIRNIEIIVVDDGSTDQTSTQVQRVANLDPRVRLISTANGGVAAARNHGIHAARSIYVAPIDADDLWHPEKLARQLELISDDPGVTFVYSSYRFIDEDDLVVESSVKAKPEGHIYTHQIVYNMVGNGSSIMFRRSDALSLGGYYSGLRAHNAEGCEDLLLQCRLARHGKVRATAGYLVGYRRSPGAMSGNLIAMQRSRILVCNILAEEDTRVEKLSNSISSVLEMWLAQSYARRLRIAAALACLGRAASRSLRGNAKIIAAFARFTFERRIHRLEGRSPISPSLRRKFQDYSPEEGIGREVPEPVNRLLGSIPSLPALALTPTGAQAEHAAVGRRGKVAHSK